MRACCATFGHGQKLHRFSTKNPKIGGWCPHKQRRFSKTTTIVHILYRRAKNFRCFLVYGKRVADFSRTKNHNFRGVLQWAKWEPRRDFLSHPKIFLSKTVGLGLERSELCLLPIEILSKRGRGISMTVREQLSAVYQPKEVRYCPSQWWPYRMGRHHRKEVPNMGNLNQIRSTKRPKITTIPKREAKAHAW